MQRNILHHQMFIKTITNDLNLYFIFKQNQSHKNMQSFQRSSEERQLLSGLDSSLIKSINRNNSEREGYFEHCRNILKKAHQSRSPTENSILLKLIEKSQFLKEVADVQGIDFLKGILRHAKIQIVDRRQVIVEEDQAIHNIVVLLQGKLAVEKSSFSIENDPTDIQGKQILDNLALKTGGLIQKLTILAKKQREQIRKAAKLHKKTTFPVSLYQFIPPVLSSIDYQKALNNVQRHINVHEQYGGKERLNSSSYKNRVFAVQKSTLLIFQMNFLFYWLEAVFKSKLTKNIQRLKAITPFDTIQEEKLKQVIVNMKLKKYRKHDIIYSQGEQAQNIYLLLQGQLKISKEVQLFKQNPNDFYVDRRKLVQQLKNNTRPAKARSYNKKSDDGVLHFANLTRLYNYRPVKKSIQISLISSFGLFGQEQVVFETKRQTTVHVNSIEASFYEIQFSKILEIIGNKAVDKFKQNLQVSISKKILYRQIQVADQIDFQNRTNMNYFYIEQGKNQQSPRKFKLQKINEKVIPRTSRDTTDHAPAFYTTFNFNKMLDRRYNSSQGSNKKRKTTESVSDAFESPRYNATQEKLIGISHSWNPIQKKVQQQKYVSRKISPVKHQINISEPLIDQQFFKDLAKQQRRINKQFRTVRLSLGKRFK